MGIDRNGPTEDKPAQLMGAEGSENSSSVGKGPARVERKLELSTGFVVGFYYHEAADLRVCQAAQSPCVSCIPSCSALLSGVNRLLEINQAPNCPSRSVESNSTIYSMLPRFFVQTPIFSVSPSSFSLSPI